jgi:hypothetical protein
MSNSTIKSPDKVKPYFSTIQKYFDDPYEWIITEFCFYRANLNNGTWTCRITTIKNQTCLKRTETILDALNRLVSKNIGFSRVPYGAPRTRRYGKGRAETKITQSYQYVFTATNFRAALRILSENGQEAYPKTDKTLSESGQESYPKTDSTRIEKKDQKKEVQEENFLGDASAHPVLDGTESPSGVNRMNVVSVPESPEVPVENRNGGYSVPSPLGLRGFAENGPSDSARKYKKKTAAEWDKIKAYQYQKRKGLI